MSSFHQLLAGLYACALSNLLAPLFLVSLTLPSKEEHLLPILWSWHLESDESEWLTTLRYNPEADEAFSSQGEHHWNSFQMFYAKVQLQYPSGEIPRPHFINNFCCLPNCIWSDCMWESVVLLAATVSFSWGTLNFHNMLSCLICRCHV